MQNLKKVQNNADAVKKLLPKGFRPRAGIVLGTGLGGFAARLEAAAPVPYTGLPAFPQSTVTSHAGRFVAGCIHGLPVLLQQGRCHLYEGRTAADVCMGVRVMACLGVEVLVVTNAAGSVNPLFEAGSLMLIEDQINLTGCTPLSGDNQDAWGARFPDMSRPYDPELSRLMLDTARRAGIALERGVYLGIPGPQLETRAETRAYRHMGADAVGMSTVLEVIAARHMGLRVLGLSCLTNANRPDCMEATTLEDIVAAAAAAEERLSPLLEEFLRRLAHEAHEQT